MSTLSRMKIKNCILIWKKENTFYTNEKVIFLLNKKRDFIEITFLTIKYWGKVRWERKPEKQESIS